MTHTSSKRKSRTTTVIVLGLGLTVLLSTFALVLLNQNATKSQLRSQAEPTELKHQFLSNTRHRNTTISPPNNTTNDMINVPIGVDHFFWRGRQNRLVKLIKKVSKERNATNNPQAPILLNLTIRCKKLYDELHLGTGNLVYGFYAVRLAAATAGVDFLFHCQQTSKTAKLVRKQGSILSWLQGYYPKPIHRELFSPYDPPLPTLNEAARGMGRIPLYYMSEAIRHDLRLMAIQLVGPREHTTLLTDNTTIEEPILSNVDLDDVAIHFRCGDLMRGFNSKDYGIVQYESYRHYISPAANTIGIVTTSFNESSLRRRDQGTTVMCKVLANGLVEYLHHAFPNAVISIRNGPEESLALAYARLVMANQTFCSPSTFSIFPAIASFGTSYIQRANLTKFVVPIAEKYDDVQLMDGGIMTALDVGKSFMVEKDGRNRSYMMLKLLMSPYCTLDENRMMDQVVVACGNATSLQ